MEKQKAGIMLDMIYEYPEVLGKLDIPTQLHIVEALVEFEIETFPSLRQSYIESIKANEFSVIDGRNLSEPPIKQLADAIFDDQLPPLHVLILVALQYKRYMNAKGNVSAERAFFDSPNGRGSFSKRYDKKNEMVTVFFWFSLVLASKKKQGKNDSDEKVLENLILEHKEIKAKDRNVFTPIEDWFEDNGGIDSIDSFLRSYRRWKKKSGTIFANYLTEKDKTKDGQS